MDELDLLIKDWTDEEKQVVYNKAANTEAQNKEQKLNETKENK